ncbi:hypothetical protein FOA52_003267 [Chlamydomonas sp. UWO 241]|nr:hypothetical protein FOA52_003267 [Chlamydomonas sp. UWO 241]
MFASAPVGMMRLGSGSRLQVPLAASLTQAVRHKLARPAAASSTSTLADIAKAGAPFSAHLSSACAAVRLASKLCQTVQLSLGDAEKEDKIDDSPVTVADYGAQAVIAWMLQRADPANRLCMVAEEDSASLTAPEGRAMLERITGLVNSIITEEDAGARLSPEDVVDLIDLGGSDGGPSGRHWVLDPIDGTRGFVGMRQYCVCLGMMQDGVMELGVLGAPNCPQGAISDADCGPEAVQRSQADDCGSLFVAHRGYGSYSCALSGDASSPLVRVRVADAPASSAVVMESYESRHSSHSFAASVAAEIGILAPSLRMDSQVKYGLLARGDEARVFMRFPASTYREKIWDHAAGVVVVEEAGGKVTDAHGDRLDFSKGRYLDTMRLGIIAGPPAVHTALVAAVAAVRARTGSASL